MMAHQQWWDSLGKDATKIVFAIRKTMDPPIIGYVQINGINSVHRSAEIGIRIGEEKNRGQGYGTGSPAARRGVLLEPPQSQPGAADRIQAQPSCHRRLQGGRFQERRRSAEGRLHRRQLGRSGRDGGAAAGVGSEAEISPSALVSAGQGPTRCARDCSAASSASRNHSSPDPASVPSRTSSFAVWV